jgi:inosine-uridine nucleoside N-ribohydrolase
MAPKIILDCDPGHDDAMAILLAGRHTELLGITAVSGNAPRSRTAPNALLMAQLLELDVPVHAGADRPLLAPARHATEVHGRTGLDGPRRPDLVRVLDSGDAVQFIIDTVRAHDDVWLVPVGPLTNIALAFRQAPDIVERIAGVSLMGGSATVGNVTSTAEFNVWADPDAAAIVFAAGVPELRMAGLNLTHQFYVDDDTVAAMRGHDNIAGHFGADLFEFYLATTRERTGRTRAALHDPCAVLAVTHPELFDFGLRHVVVETSGAHTSGMTVVDERGFGHARANCQVGYTIDREAGMEVFLATVGQYR